MPPEAVPVATLPPALTNLVLPSTSYPETYLQIEPRSARHMREGFHQMLRGTARDAAAGAVKTAMGGLDYVSSPVNAGLRTFLGNPVEEISGIPKELTNLSRAWCSPPKSLSSRRRATRK